MDYDTIDDIYLARKNPEYDAAAKKLLSSKKILAWILEVLRRGIQRLLYCGYPGPIYHRHTGNGISAGASRRNQCGGHGGY